MALLYLYVYYSILVADWNSRYFGRQEGRVYRNGEKQQLQPGLERDVPVQDHVS